MTPSFKDITDRAGPPVWFDQHGVPRYGTFRPQKVTVYSKEVALVQIVCQSCHKYISVAFSAPTALEAAMSLNSEWEELEKSGTLDELYEQAQRLSRDKLIYGDPPANEHAHNPDCMSGAVMSSTTHAVLQWWTCNEASTWIRDASKEGPIDKQDSAETPDVITAKAWE